MQKYVVGFDIADVRNLKPEGEGTCDPFVVVQCCGRTFKTQVRENKRLHVPINESLIWNDIALSEEKFETAYIEFSVYARNFWWRDYLIGKASLQLSSVNRRKAHIYSKKTVPLRKESDPENTGSITLTVWCLIPGESAPTASQMADGAAENEDGEKEDFNVDLTKAVLGDTTAQAAGSRYHLIVNIFRVEDLAPIKGFAPSPFVTVEFAGTCRSTDEAHNAAQYTFNNEIRIPVQAPICEDVVLIKLWTKGSFLTLTPDVLLAQGLVSFSELRSNALPPRWFCLYGWDTDEVDIEEITRTGERILPNFFKGRLLISGRVERIRDDEELKDANTGRAQQPVEPEMRPVALIADVYQVCGAVGKECQVRLAFGARQQQTQDWVRASRQKTDTTWENTYSQPELEDQDNRADQEVDTSRTQQEDMVTFQFTQKQGRIPPLVDMTPEDPDSQPYIMVNIYTRGIMSGELRVGYQMKKLAEFPKYDPGCPSKPRFIPMEPMPNPFSMKTRTLSSVLMVIEHYTTDDVQRHDRKNVKPMSYIVRAYIFMARNIQVSQSKNYGVRVSCAGVSKKTHPISEVRPMWMKCLELPITLCSDHPREQPTMFPITVTLCHQNPFLAQTHDDDIGKTVCVYEYMRRKDNMDRWEAFKLRPQWVQLKGGTYGSKVIGEVLIAFELLHSRDRTVPECAPRPMWPAASEEEFDEQEHFSYLRKATLHVAMYGVRDLKLKKMPPTMDPQQDLAPMVEVRVKKFRADHHKDEEKEAELPALADEEQNPEESPSAPSSRNLAGIDDDTDKFYHLGFKYREAVEGGDKDNKDDRLCYWHSDALGSQTNLNYEIFQVKKKKLMLPDKVLLQPFISLRVLERPTTFSEFKSTKSWLTGKFETDDWQLMGEYRQSLSELYPCKWLYELYNDHGEPPAEDDLLRAVQKAKEGLRAKPKFEEESAEERREAIRREREKLFQKEREKVASKNMKLIEPDEAVPEAVDTAAIPLALRLARDRQLREQALPFHSKSVHKLNMHRGLSFKPREGEKQHNKKDRSQSVLSDKLESRKHSGKKHFTPDFYFENRPLLRGHDLIDPDRDERDWNYYHKDCFGFVKCAFKLTDGWDDEDDEAKGEDVAAAALPAIKEERRKVPAIKGREGVQAVETVDEDTYENGGLDVAGAGQGQSLLKMMGSAVNAGVHTSMQAVNTGVNAAVHTSMHAVTGVKAVGTGVSSLVNHDGSAEASGRGGHVQDAARTKDAQEVAAELAHKKKEQRRMKNSFGFSEELDEFAFVDHLKDQKRFAKRFKGQEHLPSRVRVRIYFVKAICIAGKPDGQDPYLRFKLGKAYDVSMRNMYQPKTSTPAFYRVEERDIRMPEDARLVIDMYDYEDMQDMVGPMGGAVFPEQLIGSTTIDLEDRWHSLEWQSFAKRKAIPTEQRPLYHPDIPGQNCGSIEMWVEMLDSMRASEEKAADLRQPPKEQVEVRIVIWTCTEVPLLEGSGSDMSSDVAVTVKLECNQYHGEVIRFPREQTTDTHNHCTTGNAVFNWRIVFPRITVPTESCTLDITLKEVDTLSEDSIGQVTLDIRKYVEKVGRDMESVHSKADLKFHRIDKEADDPAVKKDEDAHDGHDAGAQSSAGRVQLEMWVLTQEEAMAKEAGMGRGPPNDHPPLTTPAEGRSWGDVFAGVAFELPSFGIFWKILPLILFTLLCLVALRQTGLL